MSTTQPLKTRHQIQQLKDYYYCEEPNLRNYTLICLAMNSALRISDLLNLRWRDVYHIKNGHFHTHITIVEKKTKKQTQIALNRNAVCALTEYRNHIAPPKEYDYVFPGKKQGSPLCRSQAFRIIQKAGERLQFETRISCHSLRKTFGYHAWKTGIPPAVLMAIYNHSSYQITKRYLGIDQEDKDSVFLQTNL